MKNEDYNIITDCISDEDMAVMTGRTIKTIRNYRSGRTPIPYDVERVINRINYFLGSIKKYMESKDWQELKKETSKMTAEEFRTATSGIGYTIIGDLTDCPDQCFSYAMGLEPIPQDVAYIAIKLYWLHTAIRDDMTAQRQRKMKKTINGKTYDTQTATMLAKYDNGLYAGDFDRVADELYRTPDGAYFLAGDGGEGIIPINEALARQWLANFATLEDYYAAFGEAPSKSELDGNFGELYTYYY